MFPTINVKETGANLRKIVDKRGNTAKAVQEYLNHARVQCVYYWWNGTNMTIIDNLYASSQMLQVSIDEIMCGNREAIIPELIVVIVNSRYKTLYSYYQKLNRMLTA